MDFVTVIGLVAFAAAVGMYGTIIGAGGGFLLVPGLLVLFGLEGVESVGTAVAALLAIGITGAVTYDRQGLVDRPVAIHFALGSAPVALLCSWLVADRIGSEVFTVVLAGLLLALAAFVALGPSVFGSSHGVSLAPRRGPLFAWGTAVGALAGTFAVGGGLVTVPTLARLQRLNPHRAAATTAATGLFSTIAAAVGHTLAGNVVWNHVPPLIAGAMGGSFFGARLAGRLSSRTMVTLLAGGLGTAAGAMLVKAL